MDRIIAIDVLLEPDATMLAAARAANERLRRAHPDGYALDETHAPHITLLQGYVRGRDMDHVAAAVAEVLRNANPLGLEMRATGYEYAVWAGVALIGIVVEPPPDLRDLHQRITDAVAPIAVSGGTSAAFVGGSERSGINAETIAYVDSFVPNASGANYAPHVTVGVGPEEFVRGMKADGLTPFTFGAQGVAIYQLGNFGTARKRLWAWAVH